MLASFQEFGTFLIIRWADLLSGKDKVAMVDLSMRSRPRRNWRVLFLSSIILIGIIGFAWLQGWFPQNIQATLAQRLEVAVPEVAKPIVAQLSQSQIQSSPSFETNDNFSTQPKSDVVALVDENIIDNPGSAAHTLDLHLDSSEDDPIPWPNIDGRADILIYVVQSGDSLWSISNQFGLEIDTLRWSNPELERNPDVLSVGTELVILPVQGVYHYVTGADTVEAIAASYGVAPEDITTYPPNGLYAPYNLDVGAGLIVPFGRKNLVELPVPVRSSEFTLAWPLVGVITNGYRPEHRGLDIGAPYGSPVYAAAAGTITFADWAEDGFGFTVIIDHGDGFETWYSHLKGALLQQGAIVEQGTPIGEVGSTGHSTGPHVHLEVRVNGERTDPQAYLSNFPQ